MKVSAVSGDLVVKVVLGAAALAAAWYVLQQLQDAGSGALSSVGAALDPTASTNLAYRGVNAVGGAIVTDPAGPGKNADGTWSLGGAIFDWFHPNGFNVNQ
jgi:hypothetical protein